MNVVRLDPEGHAKVQSLLPWYVTGRLEQAELGEVEEHLAGCARCRAELALERQLHAGQSVPEAPPDVDRAWAAMRRRIDKPKPAKPAFAWWRWALTAQFAVIMLLVAVLLAARLEAPRYRGLGGSGVDANAVVMFHPDATEAQMRQALHASGARLVGGPTATQAYLLMLPVADAQALAQLRGAPGVALAESLQAEPEP